MKSQKAINSSTLKTLYFLVTMLTVFHYHISISEEDMQFILEQYNLNHLKYKPKMQNFSNELFSIWFSGDIFTRVSNVTKYLGNGNGGFVFLCDYQLPVSGEIISAALKFLPDHKSKFSYQSNAILANLTGTMAEDRFRPGLQRNYSNNKDLNILQANFGEQKDPKTLYINQFYEMQWIHAQIQSKTENVTILITAPGTQDLSKPMFNSGVDIDLGHNTEEFLRIYKELCIGAANVNLKGIIHGDHKPANIILEKDANGVRHPAIIDFDLMGEFNENFDNYDNQLRFSPLYRAPSIENYKKQKTVARKNSRNQTVINLEEFYYFTKDFREDTYAIAKTYLQLGSINKSFLNTQDLRVKAILTLVNKLIAKEPFSLLNVPNTHIWAQMVSSIIDNPDKIESNVNQFLQMSFPLQNDQVPASGKFLII